ncbi:MAG: MATE family efflux transporter [Erysipelotrichaceae bacterium]
MKVAKEVDLGKEKIGKLFFLLAVPAIASQLVNALYNVVDRMYIGHIADVGATALTGVGICFPIIMIISAFAALVSMGGAPRASILMGQGDNKGAEKILGNCCSALIITSIVLTITVLAFQTPLLMMFGASENTLPYAQSYMFIYAIGTIFVQLTLGMNAFVSTQGFSKISMLTVVIGAITNIILDPIFIFVFDLGVQGAALATILSQGVSCVWVMFFLSGKKSTIKLKLKNFKLERKILLPSIALGFAPFIMQATESILVLCFNSSLLRFGGDLAVGAMTILSSVMQFAMLPLMGFTQGAQPIISYNYGANNAARVKKTFKLLLTCCLTYSSLLWLLAMLIPGVFVSVFTNDPALSEISIWALRVYMAGSLLMGAQLACQQTFIALGNAKTSAFLAMFRKIIVLIPLIFILPLFISNKVLAVFLAEPIADTLAVFTTVILFYFEFKKLMKKMKEKEAKIAS